MRTPTAELLAPDITQLLAERKWREIRDALEHLEAADAADVLDTIDKPEDAAVAFRLLPREFAADVFSHFETDKQEELIALLGDERATRLIEELDPDDRAAVLDELPVEVATPLLARLSPADRRATQAILGYPEESVGRLMTPDYIRVRPEWTVQRVLEHVRQYGKDAETIHWLYVSDHERKLIDDIHIRKFLLASPEATVESLMDHEFVALLATDDREEAVRMMNKYDRSALPVLDSLGLLVGIVTADDVADVAEAEFTEDVQKLGGMEALGTPYMSTAFGAMLKKRGGWLAGLFVLQLVTIFVMMFFEEHLTKAVVLALFVPLIISSGGNTGTQAASLLVRAIALDEVSFADWWRVARKELMTGLVLGSALGTMGVAAVYGLSMVGVADTEFPGRLAFTVGTAVVGIVIWGTLIGSLMPIAMQRLGLDPAASSSPLVATLMDVSGLTIYFAVALVVLRGTVL
ncbi:MAG: magnesium transporter MgtE [Phycisphaeraceae bacterium]|nr:MAG: magnesium transporter MgtE [Phycisphaeraceae bacterium]